MFVKVNNMQDSTTKIINLIQINFIFPCNNKSMKFTFEELKKTLKPLKTMMWIATAVCCINIFLAFSSRILFLKIMYGTMAIYSFNMMNKSNKRYAAATNLDFTITLEDSASIIKMNMDSISEKVYVIKVKFGILCTLPSNIEFDEILKKKLIKN